MLSKGFTLIELLIVSVLISLIMATAIPKLNQFIASNDIRIKQNLYKRLIFLARAEAINHATYGIICASEDGRKCSTSHYWSEYVIVFADLNRNRSLDQHEILTYQHKIIPKTDTYIHSSRSSPIVFNASGSIVSSNTTVSICGQGYGSAIVISRTGRIRSASPFTCP